jgi:cytochrome b561
MRYQLSILRHGGSPPMRWHIGRVLFWVAIGLVTSSFVLALVGEETASTTTQQTLLLWHEWIGLSSLAVLLVSFAVHALDVRPPRRLLPNWLPRFRAAVDVSFYALLILQPISGWLLASHEGKLATFFGWTVLRFVAC